MIGYRLWGRWKSSLTVPLFHLGGLKQRALLAILLLHANQPVHRDALVDELWGEHPPAGAEHAVNVYIWRLRKALQAGSGTHGVVTRQGAYLLQAAAEQVDVALFERLAEEGRRALAAEAAGHASAVLGEALALWRGAPLADFRFEPFAQAEIARLEELRAGVVEDRIQADFARASCACGRRAGGPGGRRSAARAPVPAADGCAVSVRAAGRCAGRLPDRAADDGGGARHRTVPAAAATGARDPGTRFVAGTAAGPPCPPGAFPGQRRTADACRHRASETAASRNRCRRCGGRAAGGQPGHPAWRPGCPCTPGRTRWLS